MCSITSRSDTFSDRAANICINDHSDAAMWTWWATELWALCWVALTLVGETALIHGIRYDVFVVPASWCPVWTVRCDTVLWNRLVLWATSISRFLFNDLVSSLFCWLWWTLLLSAPMKYNNNNRSQILFIYF